MSAPKMSAVALALGAAVLAANLLASAREKIAAIDGVAEAIPARQSAASPVEPVALPAVADAPALEDEACVAVARIADAVSAAFASPVGEEKPRNAEEAAVANVAVALVPRFEMYHPAFLSRAWVVQRMGLDAEERGDAAEADRLFDRYMGMLESATAAADAVDGGGEE